jgi:hypothetical protein
VLLGLVDIQEGDDVGVRGDLRLNEPGNTFACSSCSIVRSAR